MDAELVVLASSAATTIVSLLATDAWGQVKARVGDLWGRFRPEQADAVAAELERTRLELRDADAGGVLVLTRDWESRLLPLLAADAAVAPELARAVAALSQVQAGLRTGGGVRQSARASGRSTVIQVGGDATIGEVPLTPRPQPPGILP